MEEKRITDKRFGVKNYLIEELRKFQLGLKYKRKRMAFAANAVMTINMGPTRVEIQAQEGRISITPSIFPRGHRLPRQNLVNLDNRRIRLQMYVALQIELQFDSDDDKDHFINAIGDLNLSSSEEENNSIED